jgi:hypothetical protein
MLLEGSVLDIEESRQGVSPFCLLFRTGTGVPPDSQSALVPAQPATHILWSADWNSRYLRRFYPAVRIVHQMRPRLPLRQSSCGQLMINRALQRLGSLPTVVEWGSPFGLAG